MASTRASSPIGDASTPTSPQLTPRSKLKAMLAAVDDASSDDETPGPIDAKALFAAIDKSKQLPKARTPSQHDTADEDEDEDEDAETIIPRGRITARMHANFTKSNQPMQTPSQDESLRSTPEQRIITQQSLPADEADDEDDVIAPAKRRRVKGNRG